MNKIFTLLTLFCLLTSGCNVTVDTSLPTTTQKSVVNQIFSDSITEFKIRVFYESSAAPYVGIIGVTSNQTWDITKSSYTALFQNHSGRTITVPTTLAQMTSLTDQGKSSWTSAELLQFAGQSAPALVSGSQVTISVFFVKGMFEGNANILGIHFTGSPYAFVFKDVVTSTGGDSVSQRYVEQATVVHEIGHAIGLVNNGLPMVSNHEDASHSHHSSNSNCVMYWAVESKSSILSSLTNFILGNQLNLFGTESLQDGRGYHP